MTRGEQHEGKLRLLVVAADGAGGTSPIRQVEIPLTVPRLQALTAFGQKYLYELGLDLAPGEHVIAFALRDETEGIASYLRRAVDVEPPARAAATPPGR